jgi:hypothetical protein
MLGVSLSRARKPSSAKQCFAGPTSDRAEISLDATLN